MSRTFKTVGLALLLGAFAAPQAFSVTSQTSISAPAPEEAVCKGVVLDDNGEPVVGATVAVDGTNKVAATDIDGAFTLNNVKNGASIRVSYIGYKPAVLTWYGGNLDIRLQPDSQVLDDVVVIGYGAVRKADLAGAVSVLDNKAFQAQPITQASEALQGRIAGVSVVSDGIPGGSVKIRVRGTNSINKSNEPLYVVDGMVRETGLDGINPEDIQTIQVLKDASSTAIYGSRGANGVVLVQTKTARKGVTNIVFDASLGWSKATHLPGTMNAQEYASALVEWSDKPEGPLAEYINGTNPGTDWADEVFRTGVTQNYRLVVSKGNEAMQMYFSGNYMKNEGTLLGTSYERFSFKANTKAAVTDWLDLTVDVQASRGIGKGHGGMIVGGTNPLWLAFNYSPSMEIMNADRTFYNWDPYSSINENPVGMLENDKAERRRDVFAGHVDLRFKILPELTFTTSNGIDYYNGTNYNLSTNAVRGAGKGNVASQNNMQRQLLQSVNNLTYQNTFAEKHNLTATAVWEATKAQTRNLSANGTNLLTESVGWWNLGLASVPSIGSGISEWSLLSAVARVIYNYDDRYMFTGTFRADGSSRFDNNKWGYFPSAALAWTISNEGFFEDLKPTVSSLKLRTSYGIVGNQDIDPYSTMAMLSAMNSVYGVSSPTTYPGYWDNAMATPDLKWEKTQQFDFGVDVAFLNGRIDASIDYFYKLTSDALMSTNAPSYVGGAPYWINAGKVQNTGVDIAVNANVIQSKDWNWSTSVNVSFLKNKVKKLGKDIPPLKAPSLASIITDYAIIMEGEPIGSFYGFQWAGIDSEGYDTYYKADGTITRTPVYDDRRVLGKSTPDVILGWNNTVTYKNWTLNAFFSGQFGQKRYNVLRFAMNNKVGNSREITASGHREQIGTVYADPKLANNQSIGECSKYIEDADFFRLENLSISYDLPKSVTKFADVRFSLGVQNLFTITDYEGSNPASYPFFTGSSSQSNWILGVDTGTYPTNRTWTMGVRLNF